MKSFCASILLSLSIFLSLDQLAAQTFVGTNAPGQSTNFSLTIGPGATNLSLVVSNSAAAYSYLLLKRGATPTDTDFDFISRLSSQTNQINLELPELILTNYGLRVSTPASSGSQPFTVVLTTNRTDVRSAGYPVLKPLVFSSTGALTNTGIGAWHYFQVDMPSNLLTGWRIVLSSTNATPPGLYIRRNQLPTQFTYDKAASGQSIDTVIFTGAETTNTTFFLGVYLPSGAASTATYTLSTELASITPLTWDPGTTDPGTQIFTNQSVTGGDYFFSITTLNTAVGVWRTALNVSSNEADVYLRRGFLPSTSSYDYASTRTGSDGFVLSQLGGQFTPGQNWFLMVHATPGSKWNLVTGEAYVQQLPPLAADSSSGAAATVGAEGMRYFRTTISANTLAWRLGLNGPTNLVFVKKTAAPHPYTTSTYDLRQPGQMLVVPSYLNIGDQYFIGVAGNPGLNFTLDSRQQPVTDLAFNSLTNFSVTGYGYATFRVQVPLQQIAWQLIATPTAGDVNVAVRRDNVPNEFVNDAFSEVPGSTPDSVTLVPAPPQSPPTAPGLSDGTFYVTTYGTAPYTCSLTNGNPVITDVSYVFQITNDAPGRVGWRFYRIVNTAEQLGTLGWELDLSNQPPNTEIAIRRNAVPGRWNTRNNPFNSLSYSTVGYVDVSGTSGFLQHPNHQADIWYIGVYSPTNPLGNFVLTGTQLTAPPVAFDGIGSSTNVTSQTVGKLQFFRIDIPAGPLGWDLRITNVTSGDPRLVVCHDRLPDGLGTHDVNGFGWGASSSATWPSGYQWAPSVDWTGESLDPNGTNQAGHVLAMGMGNPLQPGTYYVGVLNSTGPGYLNPMSYSLMSRGIGTNLSIPVVDLPFTNGVISNLGLVPREAAYYRVAVPTNLPSWKVRLGTNSGEAMLMLQKDSLPNIGASSSSPINLSGGRQLQKAGNEQYLFMPLNGATNITAGTYYLAVASEGMNPTSGRIGTNSSAYTLTSFGVLAVTNLGTVDFTGATDILHTNNNEGGEIKAFRFTVPPGTLSLEVHLENKTGNPYMTLRADSQLPRGFDSYGQDGGLSYTWSDNSLINIANPAVTNYTLMVQADNSGSVYPDATYRIRLHAINAQPVGFDGGTFTNIGQLSGTWQYYTITVPSNAFGWDLRITNVTSGDPRLVVRRDLVPDSLGTHDANGFGWGAASSATWPSGYQWAPSVDWTGEGLDSNGTNQFGHVLATGIGNPLQAGTYYVGVINGSGSGSLNPMSYTLVSRGIGTNLSIPVIDLPFTNGVISNPGLLAREAAYYRVVVPTNLPSWKLRLGTNSGEAMLMLQKGALSNIGAGSSSPINLSGGRQLQKPGNEHYLFMPLTGATNVTAGTYYLAVVSEGMNPFSNRIGTNSSAYTLTSFGVLTVTNLGTVDFTGLTDILHTNSNEGGEIKAFQFSVPSGTLSLEVHLENKTGNPYMTLRADSQLARGFDSYGQDGGQNYTWSDNSLINIANPASTNYTLMVQADNSGGVYPDATYRIRIHAIGPTPVAFDGGTNLITGQVPGVWQYFVVNVPSNAFGWDLRITNVTSGDPRLVVRRDLAPDSVSTHDANGFGWAATSAATWPSGYQWAPSVDWTGEGYDANRTNQYGHVLAAGMGNPLQPGTYLIGVLNGNGPGSANPMSYTLVSRGIGTNLSIPVIDLPFTNGVTTNSALLAREAAYYRVSVPTNILNWKLRLTTTSGESLLIIQKDALPNIGAYAGYPPTILYGGRQLQKSGNEQYLLLPSIGSRYVVAGTYYLLVASEGVNPNGQYLGTNSSAYVLNSYGLSTVTNLGTVDTVDLLSSNTLQGGESALYQFTVPTGIPAVEVRLDNRAGNPYMTLAPTTNFPRAYDNYGSDGGISYSWSSPTLITVPNPVPTNYSLTVQAINQGGVYPDGSYAVHVRQMLTPLVSFSANLNTSGVTNVVTGTLSDGQSAFYQIVVPATNNGQAVIGWKLDLTQTSGTPKLRVRQGLLPDDGFFDGTSAFATGEAIIVPPYLTPGVWFVEVRGQNVTSFILTSSDLRTERPPWAMPNITGSVTTPGLPPGGPLFGDTAVSTNGTPLPGDGGIDLEQGNFHFYAITVPSNNVGLLRTRLDAISGDPNLYLRTNFPPTLMHNSSGYGGTLYDRSLTANIGSEYGNWVPLNGRYEAYLSPGTWYLAVQAGGNSNVRYRLRVYTGIIKDLALNGGSYASETLSGGDWQYYRAQIPTNSPVNWSVTFGQQLGDVVLYVRDRVPPGQGNTTTDYKDWSSDNKNHGPYPDFDPAGTYALKCPPLRPGNTYYLGFRAISDATFSVSGNTNGGYIDYTNTVSFYGGSLNASVPAFGTLKLRIDVPADARRLLLGLTNASAFNAYLDQGSVPTQTTSDHWYSLGNANPLLNQPLYGGNTWPWLPGYVYFLFITNTTGSAQALALGVDGRNCATDDYDNDTLSDCWELTYWPSIYSYGPDNDPDGDGVRNLDEFLEGTDPTNSLSFHPRLLVNAQYGAVNLSPPGNATTTPPKLWYNYGQLVQLTPVPSPGYGFVGWSGDASGNANPLTITMNGHLNITAVFGITSQPNADYQFQNNLHSSVGTPPDLTNIAAGNSFVTDIVDGSSRTVYRFPQGSSVQLQPANGVIPTNVYTAVLLFRFDDVTGWRRILDVKNPPADLGLYLYYGSLYFFGGASAPSPAITASNYVQIVMTRDASSNVVAYVNGVQQFSFVDSGGLAVMDGSPQTLRFFKDNGNEDPAGAVARVRLFDKVMPPAQVAVLDRLPGGIAPPRFDQPYFGAGGVLYLPAQVIPGVSYRLQGSTNLFNWINLSTNNAGSTALLFSDPLAPLYPIRFYRLVTP